MNPITGDSFPLVLVTAIQILAAGGVAAGIVLLIRGKKK